MKNRPLLFTLLALIPAMLSAWGPVGHSLVGEIAFKYLNEDAKAQVKKYLEGKSLADVANWMDQIRDEQPKTKPLHFINIEKDQTYVDAKKPNIVTTLKQVIHDLDEYGDYSSGQTEINIKYLVHLVGDLHQPLHVGYGIDIGGNNVVVNFKGKKQKLHGIWDSGIIKQAGIDYNACMAEAGKLSEADIKKIAEIDPLAWMNESRANLKSVYNFKKNEPISDEYIQQSADIIKTQLVRAGIRLAAVLNKAFSESNSESTKNMSLSLPATFSDEHGDRNAYNNITTGEELVLIEYDHYSVGYSEKYRIPLWTYYELTSDEAMNCVIDRQGSFKKDKDQNVPQSDGTDYSIPVNGKIMDKGHMVPCESLTFDCDAMASTFFYTNCVPQTTKLNRGPWRTLEAIVNDWAIDDGHILIFSGNFVSSKSKKIGTNKVTIPDSCFKVVVDISKPGIKGIAFVMPNINAQLGKPEAYVRTIDQVEKATGFDFFADFPAELQKKLESSYNLELWDFKPNTYYDDIKQQCRKYNKDNPGSKCKCDESKLKTN